MDEKSETIKMETGADKSKLVGVSMLLLTLLLTAAVASLIYIAVANGNIQAATPESTEVDVKAEIDVKSEHKDVKDKIEYSRVGHTMYNYGSDGSFEFDDFRKGIHLLRRVEGDVCYLIPVGGNQTKAPELEEFLQEWDGKELAVRETEVEAKVYDGKLTDVSFLPQKVQDECTSGYQWMAILTKASNGSDELSREKRGTSDCNWYCETSWWWCLIDGVLHICRWCYCI